MPERAAPPRVHLPLQNLVVPDGKCPLRRGKDRYETREKAQAAMRRINQSLALASDSRKIKRVYQCPEETCLGWHLTSREEYDEETARRLYEMRNPTPEENTAS